MKTNLRDFFAAAALSAVAMIALWALIGLFGISEGSRDLCTESFKGAVAWLVGK